MTTNTTPKTPAFSNLDSEAGLAAVVWENTNGKTGASFYALRIDALPDCDITMNLNKYKVDGDNKPDLYSKKAVGWYGSSKNAGIPTLTVKITDEDLAAAFCASVAEKQGVDADAIKPYITVYDNSVHRKKDAAPASELAVVDAPTTDLSDMNVGDMREYAKANGISLTGLRRRDDILAAIQG